jgi:N-acetylneuraminate epimerase
MCMSVTRVMTGAALLIGVLAASGTPRVGRLPDLPDPHGVAGAFAGLHDEHLLAAGGANFPDGVMPWEGGTKVWHDRVFALHAADGATWRDVGRLPAPNAYGVSVSTADGVLIIGGSNSSRHFREVWLMAYRDGALAFRAMPPLPVPLAQMAGARVGRYVHVTGGIDAPAAVEALSRHYQLDLDAPDKGWRELPPLPGAGRILATAAGTADGFYVVGGCSLVRGVLGTGSRTYLREAWRFGRRGWQRLADLPTALAAAASPAPIFARDVYVVSGDDGRQVGASPAQHRGFGRQVIRYDARRNKWLPAGELEVPPPVTVPTVPWQDGFAIVSGEVRPGVRTPQVLLFRAARESDR